jgi:ribonucleoside-diphosphate reductase alpha chain
MAEIFGEPEVMQGYGRRNSTLLAVAPTTSSAFILGQVSQSIEPVRSNYYVKDLAKLKSTYRNPYLQKLLEEKGRDDRETWDSILEYDGSVQHLDFLSEKEKMVFKTFSEISQLDLVQQVAQRQKYIDQAQSFNIMVHPDTPTKDINSLYIRAWELGVKTLYYQHSVNAAQEFNRDLMTCVSCEG